MPKLTAHLSLKNSPISIFQLTALFSMFFALIALIGFSYNVWRMEISEYNANVRDASFEMLLQLSELELIIYAGHYDKDKITGNPRKAWVKVGLINDLSQITNPRMQKATELLRQSWQENWQSFSADNASTTKIIASIDTTREEVRFLLATLE
jgi:hypothetical protein